MASTRSSENRKYEPDEYVLDENEKIDPLKVNALVFDKFQNGYLQLKRESGQAWNAGMDLMKQ